MKKMKYKFSVRVGSIDENINFIIKILKKYLDIKLFNKLNYLIYSANSNVYLKCECLHIFYTEENLDINFNCFEYATEFHHINFILHRYILYLLHLVKCFKAYYVEDYIHDLLSVKQKHRNIKELSMKKSKFHSFVYFYSQVNRNKFKWIFLRLKRIRGKEYEDFSI